MEIDICSVPISRCGTFLYKIVTLLIYFHCGKVVRSIVINSYYIILTYYFSISIYNFEKCADLIRLIMNFYINYIKKYRLHFAQEYGGSDAEARPVQEAVTPLNLDHLQGIFFLTVAGWTSAVLVFIFENVETVLKS